MQAIVLLGGQGTRLRALYPDRPKALVPVAGRPFIEWQIDWLRRGGITDVHLAAGHLAEQIEAWAATQDRVTVSREEKPLGTAGALTAVPATRRAQPFWVINGDTLLPTLDFQRLENTHHHRSNDWKRTADCFQQLEKAGASSSNDWTITIAVTHIEEAGRYGTVIFDDAQRITAFREKAQRAAGWINGGVYLIDPQALETIPANTFCSLETDLFPTLLAGGRLGAFPTPSPLLDMGTPDGLAQMEAFLTR